MNLQAENNKRIEYKNRLFHRSEEEVLEIRQTKAREILETLNNERSIGLFTIGRKNSISIGSEDGAEVASVNMG